MENKTTMTVFQKALADMGHTFSQALDGSWEVEADPKRAGKHGEISESDYQLAEEAVRKAYKAGQRSVKVLGMMFHPDCPGDDHACESVTTPDGHGAYCRICGETLAKSTAQKAERPHLG